MFVGGGFFDTGDKWFFIVIDAFGKRHNMS